MPTTAKSPEEFAVRFWAKVDRSGECWIWLGAKTPAGYGNLKHRQRTLFAHRVAFKLAHGEESLTDEDLILHSCDVRLCVRPEHLRPGTHRENMAECTAKLRNRKEGTKAAKLTAEQVRDLRSRYDAGETQGALAKAFGLTQSGVSNIVLKKTWSWV